jgi:predicted neuraminidase
LANGHWLLISNDTERGRDRLAVQISEDEGKTWKWKRYLETAQKDATLEEYHYPSIIQGKDGTLHASYSYHWKPNPNDTNSTAAKTIKYVNFNEEWIRNE